ncbi:D-aspartate oxidase isoform X2 [Athalia rosae]|uniref:D-aspartate oxidase isoform X2 n=1 Tax=Athalia rosae TaxID=37344 RepID=UPI00203474A9|nr:D-aspartate oxidase isoform X2 [Athalia rosae]
MRIAVIGGGIVGLTTSLKLREELRNSNITIFADSFDDTTSHVAAGLFRIGNSFSGPTEELTRKWVKDAYEYYDDIRKSSEAGIAGVAEISGYYFAKSDPRLAENRWFPSLVPVYRKVQKAELDLVGNEWNHGTYFTTLLTDPTLFLPWGRSKLQENDVKLLRKRINSFAEIASDFDVIMNCSGLGARYLCNDRRLVPIRGVIAKVKAPWIKTAFFGESDTYIIPGFNGTCTLGGVRTFESDKLNICPYEATALRERCNGLVPSLAKAKTIKHLAGLRPHRETVRVEPEIIGKTRVIHNYGHGAYGVCTAPGTASYAVQLVKDVHRSTSQL